jgi:hypothetical protein
VHKLFDGDAQLINADGNFILYVEGSELFELDRETQQTRSYGETPWILQSAYLTDDKILVYGYSKDEAGQIIPVYTSILR